MYISIRIPDAGIFKNGLGAGADPGFGVRGDGSESTIMCMERI